MADKMNRTRNTMSVNHKTRRVSLTKPVSSQALVTGILHVSVSNNEKSKLFGKKKKHSLYF